MTKILHLPPRNIKWIHVDDKTFKPLETLENTKFALSYCEISVRFDQMTGLLENSAGNMTRIKSELAKLKYKLSSQDIINHVSTLAEDSQFHPVIEWLREEEWDGEKRLNAFFDTLEIDNPTEICAGMSKAELCKTLVYRWMLGAMSLILNDKPEPVHGVLVLQGKQGIGKTSWIRKLCPVPKSVLTGIAINPGKVDSVRQATSAWVCELGELDGTFRKSDIAALKAFITQSEDMYRRPYAVDFTYKPRRTIYTASVNRETFLVDDTGNRRWWTVPVKSINWEHNINMRQVWLEIEQHYLNGKSPYLTSAEKMAMNAVNKQHEELDPYVEILTKFYPLEGEPPQMGKFMTVTDVYLDIYRAEPTYKGLNGLASALKKIGYKRVTRKGYPGYIMPPKIPNG